MKKGFSLPPCCCLNKKQSWVFLVETTKQYGHSISGHENGMGAQAPSLCTPQSQFELITVQMGTEENPQFISDVTWERDSIYISYFAWVADQFK